MVMGLYTDLRQQVVRLVGQTGPSEHEAPGGSHLGPVCCWDQLGCNLEVGSTGKFN